MSANPPIPRKTLLPAVLALLVAFLLAVGFLLAASINGNATATHDLDGMVTWLTGSAWAQIGLIVLAVLVPSPVERLLAQALTGNTKPLADAATPVINRELAAVNIPLQIDSSQAETALSRVAAALVDAHSSTESLTAKIVDAADKAAHASIISMPTLAPIATRTASSGNGTPALPTATVLAPAPPPAAPDAPAGPLSAPAS